MQHDDILPAAALVHQHPAPGEPRHAEAAMKMRQTFGVSVKQISFNQEEKLSFGLAGFGR